MSQTLEDIKRGTVRIEDSNRGFYGTGFSIQKEYFVTCHHNICYIKDNIFVAKDDELYEAEWVPEYSDMKKDIAVLRVKDIDASILRAAGDIFKDLEVVVWGFPESTWETLGGEDRWGKLCEVTTRRGKEEKVDGNKSWNKKPAFNVQVYKCDCTDGRSFEKGLSGSPVCEKNSNKVVAIFEAFMPKHEGVGYVIPIGEILDKFQKEPKVVAPSYIVDVGKLLDEGNEYYYKKDYLKAIEYYDKIINDPSYARAWYNKGTALDYLGRYDEAIKCYDKAIEINPNNAKVWYNKGIALRKLGKYNEAIKCYDRAIEINPNYAYAWYGKGFTLDDLGKYNEAIKCYDKAIEIDPNYADALCSKGIALRKLGKYNEAIKCYDRAIEINPNHVYAWYNKGFALDDLGKYDEAIKCYDKAIEINPNDAEVWNNKGVALDYLGRYEEAIKCYDKAIEINPNYTKAKNNKRIALDKLRIKK